MSKIQKKHPASAAEKIKQIVLNTLLILSLLLVLFVVVTVVVNKDDDRFIFGYKPYIISSESMYPIYQKYAIVLVKNTSYDDVAVGDLIAFKADAVGGKPAFHRVIEISPEGFTTKGDANKMADEQKISQTTFIGKEVWHTNLTAKILPMLSTTNGIMLLIVIPILTILLIISLVKILRPTAKPDKVLPTSTVYKEVPVTKIYKEQ
ncbi:MAG: signal peptidase I [Oscillospiraceae bacterium]|nr:signal peptidase I [Oscillospiraceae bacterium]